MVRTQRQRLYEPSSTQQLDVDQIRDCGHSDRRDLPPGRRDCGGPGHVLLQGWSQVLLELDAKWMRLSLREAKDAVAATRACARARHAESSRST
eukprot:3710291-Pyramimonas_sp.AAC.1